MSKAKILDSGRIAIKCPGCGDIHEMNINPAKGHPVWGFNNDLEKPTFTPSLLMTCGHYVPGETKDDCWCTYNENHPENKAPFECYVCHSFVTNGKIQFLNDCTHKLAGQTVELIEY